MPNNWNDEIIKEFRANAGTAKAFAKQPILLLHTTGAKSGAERVNPLAYLKRDDTLYVFASFNARPIDPAWYHNLKAHPKVTVEVGTETFEASRPRYTEPSGRDLRRTGRVQPGIRRVRDEDEPGHPGLALSRLPDRRTYRRRPRPHRRADPGSRRPSRRLPGSRPPPRRLSGNFLEVAVILHTAACGVGHAVISAPGRLFRQADTFRVKSF